MKRTNETVEELLSAAEEAFSKAVGADWWGILPTLAPVAGRLLASWLLRRNVQYEEARLREDRTPKGKLLSLGPAPDYVEGLIEELEVRQVVWLRHGKSGTEVLVRTIGWGLDFLRCVLRMTWDNIRATAREQKQEKRNREG